MDYQEKIKIEDNFNLFESYLTPGNYISYNNIIKENDLFDKNYLFLQNRNYSNLLKLKIVSSLKMIL